MRLYEITVKLLHSHEAIEALDLDESKCRSPKKLPSQITTKDQHIILNTVIAVKGLAKPLITGLAASAFLVSGSGEFYMRETEVTTSPGMDP